MAENKLIAPTLTDDEVRGTAEAGSVSGIEFAKDFKAAKAALARADSAELFLLYERAIRRRNEIEFLFTKTVEMYIGKNDRENLHRIATPPSDSAVQTIEKIALAAIDLAKTVIGATKC